MRSWLPTRGDWHSPSAVTEGPRVVLRPRRPARLHLGCGERYLKRYLNVDLSPSEGVASGQGRPDVEADIRSLVCPGTSLREIRLHHVFEHFTRAEGLALLVQWYDWLVPRGRLVLETPDFASCVAGFDERDFGDQTVILRHLFGSQEATWATHRDGWSAFRFTEVLSRLGYVDLELERGFSDERALLANVTVTARRPLDGPERAERRLAARALLELSMSDRSQTETELLNKWLDELDRTLGPA